MKKIITTLQATMLLAGGLYAQHQPTEACGTQTDAATFTRLRQSAERTAAIERYFLENYHQRNLMPIEYVPIKAHIIRQTDGTGGLTLQELDAAMVVLNTRFMNANLQFFLCDGVHYIDDDTYYDYDGQTEQAGLTGANNVSGLINVYFADQVLSTSGSSACGYAYYPGGMDAMFLENSCVINGSTFPHEMGHFFSLMHTHGGTSDELVDGSNCLTEGDLICDTPADPGLSGKVNSSCIYTGTEVDANGDFYTPDPLNIMSYSLKACRTLFTPTQYARLYAAYVTDRDYFICPSQSVDFTASGSTQTCENSLTVQFTDASVGATSWAWDVDSDGLVDYTTPNVTHTYTTAGTYNVQLTITGSMGTTSETKENFVQVGAVYQLPYLEDFETFFPDNGAIGLRNGWAVTPADNTNLFRWNVNKAETPTDNTGPLVDNTLGTVGGIYMFAESSQGSNGAIAELLTPCIELNATDPELSFAYHLFGATMGTLHVDINAGSGWVNDVMTPIVGQQQTAQEDPYLMAQVPLTGYAGQTVQLRFRAERANGSTGDMAIDDVQITGNTISGAPAMVGTTPSLLEVAPNPSTGIYNLRFQSPKQATTTIRVLDLLGKAVLVFQTEVSEGDNNFTLELKDQPAGTYLLQVQTEGKQYVERLVKW